MEIVKMYYYQSREITEKLGITVEIPTRSKKNEKVVINVAIVSNVSVSHVVATRKMVGKK